MLSLNRFLSPISHSGAKTISYCCCPTVSCSGLAGHYVFLWLCLSLLLLLPSLSPLNAQSASSYGNEWINYNQTYYKIKVAKDGIHRILYSTLNAAGLPADASGYRLYHRGEEVPLYISANVMASNDYIEFIGQKNDGRLDANLYQDTTVQLSPYKSLFSDTTAYFLLWENPNSGQRFSNIGNNISTHPPTETYFTHHSTTLFTNDYYGGRPNLLNGEWVNASDFEPCEGWVSLSIAAGQTQSFNIPTASVYSLASTPAACIVRMAGRNDEAAITPDHPLQILVNGTMYKDTVMEGYYCEKLQFLLPLTALNNPQTTVNVSSLPVVGTATNNNSVAFVQITYPHSYNFENKQSFAFVLPDQAERYIEISNFNGGVSPVLYDIDNQWRIVPTVQGGLYKIKLPEGSGVGERHLLISSTTSIAALTVITQISERHFTNYNQPAQQGNYVIIAHPLLRQGSVDEVERYATYRSSYTGGDFGVVSADIEELYDQFAYGIPKHPLAIVNFLGFARDMWPQPPNHVLLLGKALTYSEINPTNYSQCLVPTFGSTPSDLMLGSRPKTGEWLPQMAMGRVPARSSNELRAYLDKLIAYEASSSDISCELNDIWRKNVVSLATANDIGATEAYAADVAAYQTALSLSDFASYSLGTYQQAGQTLVPLPEFENAMNNGLGLIFFKGEQQNFYWRMDVHTPDLYQNTAGRYPFIIAQSEFVGNVHRLTPTMANDFVMAEDKGAIGFLDNAQKYYADYNDTLVGNLVARISGGADYTQSIGQNLRHTIQEMYGAMPNFSMKYVAQNYTLAGDPALSIVPNRKVELLVQPENLSFYNIQSGDPLFSNPIYIGSNMPNFEARLLVYNTGRHLADSVNVRVRRWLPNGEFVEVAAQRIAVPVYNTLVTFVLPNDLPEFSGANTYFFTVDADGEVDEWCENNNVVAQPADIHPYIVGIESVEAGGYNFYPVPAQSNLYITAPVAAQVNIFDGQGKFIERESLVQGTNLIDVSKLAAGYYYLQMSNEQGFVTKPLIIVR